MTREEMKERMATGTEFRNVQNIIVAATRVIRGRVPAEVRKELNAAVKVGLLGHLKKDGLKPEIYYNPDHKWGAVERQNREAEYAAKCIASVMVTTQTMKAELERGSA